MFSHRFEIFLTRCLFQVNLENDELLGDLMGELDHAFGSKSKNDSLSTRNTPSNYGVKNSKPMTNDTFTPKDMKSTPTSGHHKEIFNKFPRNIMTEWDAHTPPDSDDISKVPSETKNETKPTPLDDLSTDSK